jgi:sugar/nucleoside kinase (ribokinase family)
LVVAPLALDDVTTPAGSYRDELGGSATYAALAARHFAPTSIAAAIGNDFPAEYLERLSGIDLSRVARVAGASFRWVAVHHRDGTTETQLNEPGATAGVLPELGDLRQQYVLVGALDPALQERVGPAGFVAIDTMPCYIDQDAPRLRRALAGADAAFLTLDEAERLVGSRRAEEVRRAIGARLLVLKDGANGAVIAHESGSFAVPAYPTRVVDPTGAGDAFAGAFVATLAARGDAGPDSLTLAARRGAAAASITVEDYGARALQRADRRLIERRAEQLAEAPAGV